MTLDYIWGAVAALILAIALMLTILAGRAAHAAEKQTPAICFTEITEKVMKICGDLSDCVDRPGECEAIERDRQAHIKAGHLVCDNKKNCKLAPNPYAAKDYIWDCASYRWKWEDRSFGRPNGYKTLADACVKRNCGGNNQFFCNGGNLGYVPSKLRRQQLRDLGRVPHERYVRLKPAKPRENLQIKDCVPDSAQPEDREKIKRGMPVCE
jgi:hypothetical protein